MADPQMAQMMQVAAQAAQAAAEAADAMRKLVARDEDDRKQKFSEASKVVRMPDSFGSEDHEQDQKGRRDFLHNFKSWLYYADGSFETGLTNVDQHPRDALDLNSMEPSHKAKSVQLYAILSGLLKGKPLRVLRQQEDRNGLEVYRQLVQTFTPSSRTRSLSLLQALMQFPQFTRITEKLELPSTDGNVAALRWFRTHCKVKLEGWVLDERKAYRQIAVRPDHRKWSVVSLRDPKDGRQAFFVMIGHSFGLVSAVYNYNRRSAAITDILRRVFSVAAFNFYDDKYGFEPSTTCRSAYQVAQRVHFWLGARFDAKKLQLSEEPTILGVTYDLRSMCLRIKPSRKKELQDEINSILDSALLPPGQAGKLRGKLMFGASQLWGKIGRAFLRSLSERQYIRHPRTLVRI